MATCTDPDDETFREDVQKEMSDALMIGSDELFVDVFISPPTKANLPLEKRFGKLDIFTRPLCLVYTDDKKNLQIDEKVLHQISCIDVPISVVGVCGVYRTGKSYLMNILAQERSGFSLGNSVRSHTKGIWAWCKPHPTVSNQVLILLDTEGLADAAKGDEDHDMKLFCLTMLMSSALIYNMKGVIDQDALKRLSFITDLTKQISVGGRNYSDEEEDKNTLEIISPHFVLCLRDFFYQLVDNGEMTPDEYMESCLLESSDKQNDNLRRSISKFFPTRGCFVLSQPAMNKHLLELETLDENSIDSGFMEDVEKLKTYVYNLAPKLSDKITRKRWDGKIFDVFLSAYVNDLSRGHKMEYGSAMENAGRIHNSKLKVTVCRKYKARLDEFKLPQKSELDLLDTSVQIMHELLRYFRQNAYPYLIYHFEDNAAEEMKRMMHDLVHKNNREVIVLCCDYLERQHEMMVQEKKKIYKTEDGDRTYGIDFDKLLQKYEKEFSEYDRAERCEALQKFNNSIKMEVLEMKYEAKLQGEINKREELQKTQRVYMDEHINKTMYKLKKEQERKMHEQLQSYEERMPKTIPGNIGFLKRLKFLFRGNLDEETCAV